MAKVRIKGPWKGMDLRGDGANPGTAALSINMDCRNGVLRPRRPWERVASTPCPILPTVHLVDRPGLPQYLLSVGGLNDGASNVTIAASCRISDPATGATIGTTTLTTERRLRFFGLDVLGCSFVDTFLRSSDGNPRPATLIVCETSTWVFEPMQDATVVRIAAVATDSTKVASASMSYWLSVPRGPIAVSHATRVFYAGFKDGVDVVLDSPIESDATDIPESFLRLGRASLRLSPGVLYFSDSYDALGVPGSNFFFIPGEVITGLHPMGEVLLVFTDKAIWVLSGGDEKTFGLTRISSGTGCVNHHSIVEVDGIVYFASDNGIYAFGGLAAPETVKVSEPLDQLWTGWESSPTFMPDAMKARLAALGFPWSVQGCPAELVRGCYWSELNMVSWCYRSGGASQPGGVAFINVVLDLSTRGWGIWFQVPNGYDYPPFGAYYALDGEQYMVSVVGSLMRYDGSTLYDGPSSSSSDKSGVPAFWLSARQFSDDAEWKKVLDTRVKLIQAGSFPSNDGASTSIGSGAIQVDVPMFVLSGEAEAFDDVSDAGTVVSSYSNRGSTVTGALPLVAHAGVACLGTTHSNAQFTLGTSILGSADWVTVRCEGQVGAKSFRFGFIDDARTNATRGPRIAIAAIEFDVLSEGTAHR